MAKIEFSRGFNETIKSFLEFEEKGLKEGKDLVTIVGEYMLTREYRELYTQYNGMVPRFLGMIMNEERKILNKKIICGAGTGFDFSELRRYPTSS